MTIEEVHIRFRRDWRNRQAGHVEKQCDGEGGLGHGIVTELARRNIVEYVQPEPEQTRGRKRGTRKQSNSRADSGAG